VDSTPTPPPQYLVLFQALPSDAPAATRLKRLFKTALRTFRLRVVDAREVTRCTPAEASSIAQDVSEGSGQADGPPTSSGPAWGPAGGPRP
jgi:hypothetical protein